MKNEQELRDALYKALNDNLYGEMGAYAMVFVEGKDEAVDDIIEIINKLS